MRHDKLNNYSLVIQEEVTKHMQQWYALPLPPDHLISVSFV